MHGNILVIDTYQDIEKRGGELYDPPWQEWDMKDWIPGCDYVCHEPECFDEDCEWFQKTYSLEGHMQRKLFNNEHPVYEVQIKPLIEALRKRRETRIEEIRAELEREKPDLWNIYHIAWTNTRFWFLISGGAFMPEMGFLAYLESLEQKGKDSSILIICSYDYHI